MHDYQIRKMDETAARMAVSTKKVVDVLVEISKDWTHEQLSKKIDSGEAMRLVAEKIDREKQFAKPIKKIEEVKKIITEIPIALANAAEKLAESNRQLCKAIQEFTEAIASADFAVHDCNVEESPLNAPLIVFTETIVEGGEDIMDSGSCLIPKKVKVGKVGDVARIIDWSDKAYRYDKMCKYTKQKCQHPCKTKCEIKAYRNIGNLKVD